MKRRLAAMLGAVLAGAAAGPLRAQEIPYAVTIDGRPLDAVRPGAREHDGVVFMNLVKAVRAFDGVLTFSRDGTCVTIGAHSIVYHIGQPAAETDGAHTVSLSDAPFVENGDIFIPVDSFAKVAGATVAIDKRAHRLDLRTFRSAARPTPAA
jgi:hypothetical protein